jgi:hypothetical protein
MALYLISYDIAEKDEFEYAGLWDALKSIGAVRILYSEWVVVEAQGRAGAIYDTIGPKTQLKDRLLVQEILRDARWDKLLISDADFQGLLRNARG